MTQDPVIVEVTRGARVESMHRGAIAIARPDGELVAALGDVTRPVFPRSAIKPLQALPLIETGAADRFGFGQREIAIACASHAGTPEHAAVVAGALARAGLDLSALGCGVHEPLDAAAARELIRTGLAPTALNHNCSGKHAGMLATAVSRGEPPGGYWLPDHPVQGRVRGVLEDMTGQSLGAEMRGIDGCSVPNWAIPLASLAAAFARFVSADGLSPERRAACRRLAEACWAEPVLVAGRGRLDTEVMRRVPGKVLMKSGAEGVHCGAFPELGLGFALKIDDGGKRAADLASAALVARFYPATDGCGPDRVSRNFRGLEVGEMRMSEAFARALATAGPKPG
jgi:L-asparaginase II